MLAFPSMIAESARRAGMKVPPDEIIDEEWNPDDYPHFHVFCNAQLGRRMSDWAQHWDNAKIIAGISEDELKTLTFGGLVDKGLQI